MQPSAPTQPSAPPAAFAQSAGQNRQSRVTPAASRQAAAMPQTTAKAAVRADRALSQRPIVFQAISSRTCSSCSASLFAIACGRRKRRCTMSAYRLSARRSTCCQPKSSQLRRNFSALPRLTSSDIWSYS